LSEIQSVASTTRENLKIDKILAVAKILSKEQGDLSPPRMDPLDCLLETILSQNTNDKNRDIAFSALRKKYPKWELLLDAEHEEIAETIRTAGLANQKGDTIFRVLRWLQKTYETLSLDWLNDLETEAIFNLFAPIKGIGIKTLSIVCCFGLGRDVFPVDTHVNRICQRLGWVDEKSTPNHTFYKMAEIMPAGIAPVFHIRLIEHGRSTCTARNPKCDECSLKSICKFYST